MEATQEQVAVRMGDESKVGVVSPAFNYLALHEASLNGHNFSVIFESFHCYKELVMFFVYFFDLF